MTIFAIYNDDTDNVVGAYEADEAAEAPEGFTAIEAPVEFTVESNWALWKYDGVSAIVMKTGDEFKEAFYPTKRNLISKYFPTFEPIEVIGDIEGAADVAMQMVHHFVNGTTPTQDEKDNWNAFYNANKDFFRYALTASIPQYIWDAMGAAKEYARTKEAELKDDPEWVDPS